MSHFKILLSGNQVYPWLLEFGMNDPKFESKEVKVVSKVRSNSEIREKARHLTGHWDYDQVNI